MSAQLALPLAPPKGRARYFQTTRLSPADLADAIARAEQQDDAVLALFRVNGALAPSEAWKQYQAHGKQAPLTSIRRSITTLTNAGALVKTGLQVPGLYGSPEHVWRLAA